MNTTLAARVARKLGHNLAVAAILITAVMAASIETPKESVQRPGLSEDALTEICESPSGVRPDCPTN